MNRDPAAGAQPKRLPPAFKQRLERTPGRGRVAAVLDGLGLHTVCQEARCPNRNNCYSQGTATFMILGDCCTRQCRFCAVAKGRPGPPDPGEPRAVAEAVKRLGLGYAVITSVTRDDLPDGGAGAFVASIARIREACPGTLIEVLTPDFAGEPAPAEAVFAARPDVFNHNIETVPRLYPAVRPQADYRCSLGLLQAAKARGLTVKSGMMAGLGETFEEAKAALGDLATAGCDIATIGQYLAPTPAHHPVDRYWSAEEYEECRRHGEAAGIRRVVAGPLVRSSYHAREAFLALTPSTLPE